MKSIWEKKFRRNRKTKRRSKGSCYEPYDLGGHATHGAPSVLIISILSPVLLFPTLRVWLVVLFEPS